jgi:copper(I)-binding protein
VSSSTARFPSSGSRSAALLLTAGAASLALLTACGTGQVAQTAQKVASVEGVSASRGNIDVDNAHTAPPLQGRFTPGSDVPVYLTISNDGLVDDRLVAVESDAGTAVVLAPAPEGATPPPLGCVLTASEVGANPTSTVPPLSAEGAPSPSTTASGSESASPSSSPSASASTPSTGDSSPEATASPEPSPEATGSADIDVLIPHDGAVKMTEECPHLVVQGVTEELWPSDAVHLRLTFEKAGTIELKVPVGTPSTELPREAVPGFDTHGGGHGAEAESGSGHGTETGAGHGEPSPSADGGHGHE